MMSPIIVRRNNTCSKPFTLASEIEMTACRRAWASESARRSAVLLAIPNYRRTVLGSLVKKVAYIHQEPVPSRWSFMRVEKK